MYLRMTVLYHYNMDVASLRRYCGWRHTGDYRRWEETLFWLKFILNDQEYEEVAHGFQHGIPQEIHSNDHNTYSSLQQYITKGNLKSIHDNPALVSKNFAKEDAREFSMNVPAVLVSSPKNTKNQLAQITCIRIHTPPARITQPKRSQTHMNQAFRCPAQQRHKNLARTHSRPNFLASKTNTLEPYDDANNPHGYQKLLTTSQPILSN
jgi:hypothetical protein